MFHNQSQKHERKSPRPTRSFWRVVQGHALLVFVHREMSKLQSKAMLGFAGKTACPTTHWRFAISFRR
jgi:hypothetical protein